MMYCLLNPNKSANLPKNNNVQLGTIVKTRDNQLIAAIVTPNSCDRIGRVKLMLLVDIVVETAARLVTMNT